MERTVEAVKKLVRSRGGWIPFDEYVNLCLYDPNVGYYGAWIKGIGSEGDYVTAPELGSLFGELVARKIGPTLRGNGGQFLELGAGTGKFARKVVGICQAKSFGLDRYSILEVSSKLRSIQMQELCGCREMEWLDALPVKFSGVAFGNELIDSVPCSIYRLDRKAWLERGVTTKGGALAWEDRPPLSGSVPERLSNISAENGYLAEVNLMGEALVRSLLDSMERGVAVLIDYGFARGEFYHPERRGGTLMCHWRHCAFPDPLAFPGISDITSHVDFTGIAEAAKDGGGRILGFCDLGDFLADFRDSKLLDGLPQSESDGLPMAEQAKRLLMPHEMGQLFKVLVIGKGDCVALSQRVRNRPL